MEELLATWDMKSSDGVNKQFHLLASVFCGIIMCKIVYDVTGIVTSFCFKGYGKLTNVQKVEWKNRGISTFHAILVAVASFYLLMLSGLYAEDSENEELLVNRSFLLSNSILGISVGYFLSDLAMILWFYPALGGMEYVLHHGLSMFSIMLSLVSGQGQFYILMVLFSESTTPSINLRWYLDVAGQKNSKLYLYNGVALFLAWLVARILLFIYFFAHMLLHFDQVQQMFPLCFYSLLLVPPILTVMNIFWFWKILKGLIKTLSKTRHSE